MGERLCPRDGDGRGDRGDDAAASRDYAGTVWTGVPMPALNLERDGTAAALHLEYTNGDDGVRVAFPDLLAAGGGLWFGPKAVATFEAGCPAS